LETGNGLQLITATQLPFARTYVRMHGVEPGTYPTRCPQDMRGARPDHRRLEDVPVRQRSRSSKG